MLAVSVARMCRSGEDHLKWALAPNCQQLLGVAEQQSRTLVIRHSARKANERNVKSQGDVQRLFHVGQQRAFSLFVSPPDRLVRYLVGIFQDFRLMRPLRDDGLK